MSNKEKICSLATACILNLSQLLDAGKFNSFTFDHRGNQESKYRWINTKPSTLLKRKYEYNNFLLTVSKASPSWKRLCILQLHETILYVSLNLFLHVDYSWNADVDNSLNLYYAGTMKWLELQKEHLCLDYSHYNIMDSSTHTWNELQYLYSSSPSTYFPVLGFLTFNERYTRLPP